MKNRVRAIIFKDDKLLTVKRVLPDRTFWVAPGGGVERKDKSKENALVRECGEEVNLTVRPLKMIWERDFKEQKEYFYLTDIIKGTIGKGAGPEYDENGEYIGTHEPLWLNIADLKNIIFYPENLKNLIINNYEKAIKQNQSVNWQEIDWSSLSR